MNSGIISIGFPETDDDDLRRLANWLRDEDELRGRVSLVNRPPAPGQMGATLDVLQVAVASGGVASVAVTSLFGWLSHRGTARKVTLRLRADNGREIAVTCGSPDDLGAVLDQVRDFWNG
ncbi:MAG TPA: hypothetical protein VHV74_06415 [Pseudonocardiaceae bacterium]|nr:hypothetical protein [Pseudonocardiaceae bacterium]